MFYSFQLYCENRTKREAVFRGVAGLTNIACNLVLLNLIGYVGGAISLMISWLVLLLLYRYYSGFRLNIAIPEIIQCTCGAIVIASSIRLLGLSLASVLSLGAVLGTYFAVYAGAAYFLLIFRGRLANGSTP